MSIFRRIATSLLREASAWWSVALPGLVAALALAIAVTGAILAGNSG